MEVSGQFSNGHYNIHLQGRFTFNDNPVFREVILDKINDPEVKTIALNMERVEFVDSAALGMLLLAHDEAKALNKQLHLHGINGQVKRIFDMARFDQFFHY